MEKCCKSMAHWEHMCSLNLNGCAIEKERIDTVYECVPCDDKSHNHRFICTPSLIGT